jgi:lactoylglutathione lyase
VTVPARISHVNIRVADVDRSVRFYEAIGLSRIGAAVLAPGYFLIYLGNPAHDEVSVELVVNQSAPSDYDRSPGAGHVGVVVDDLDATLETLAQLGIAPEGAPAHPAGRQDLPLVAFVRDPDGVRVELIETAFRTPQDEPDDAMREALGAR